MILLNFFQDKIVGFSLCNEKETVYVPINHRSPIYDTKLKNQIPEEDLIAYFKELNETRHFKWIYHNSKFDLGVFRTFLGFNMPAPYWDTLICGNILDQNEDHRIKITI